MDCIDINIEEEDKFAEDLDLREVLESSRKKLKMDQAGQVQVVQTRDDELIATQQQLKHVTEKMEIMRKEMFELQNDGGIARYALGFDPMDFNKLKYTESLQWVSTNLVVAMKQEMENFPDYFRFLSEIGGVVDIGNKTCAGYNRGATCRKKWHTYIRHTGHREVEELRLHCCVLCMEAMGVLSGHPLINCPWVKASTWSSIPN
jgi:hypothetical protein